MTKPGRGDRRGKREELVFRMSSERHREAAIEAIDMVGSSSVFAFPVQRVSTGDMLLLVLKVDPNHALMAVSTLVSVDAYAQPLPS